MFSKVYDIAASAMSANKMRIDAVSSNIANAHTTRTAEGGPYKRRDVVFQSQDVKAEQFANVLDKATLKTVRVSEVVEDKSPPNLMYDPGHPDADPKTGMVAMPNINIVTEMTNMLTASSAYKAAAQIATTTQELGMAVRRLFN